MQAAAMQQPAVDLAALKTKQQAAWGTGDYAVIGTTLQWVGESLAEALDLRAGARVLDVAAGNGNATLAAARRGCDVVSIDYVPQLLEKARARAAAEGLEVAFQQADAEHLPFDTGAFDAVVSTFGVMFTPHQERAASEMLRVCRPGGSIGLANWTPHGFIGEVFKAIGGHLPPPAGVRSPMAWGTEERLQELFPAMRAAVSVAKRHFTFRYRSARHWLDTFRTFYGPMNRAFAALDARGQAALEADLLQVAHRFNFALDGTLIAPSQYLEVVVRRL
jgi:ubiquinone/menaquinone biosynthesis C-methylase UbiE